MNGILKVVEGDVTNPQKQSDNEIAIIPHCCNNKKVMGAGVALALKKKWPAVEYYYQKSNTELGSVSYAMMYSEEPDVVVANMIGQDGTVNANNTKPVKYWALAKAMKDVFHQYELLQEKNPNKKFVIHCPKFGSDLAGGRFEFVLELIKEIWIENGIDVVIYEFNG